MDLRRVAIWVLGLGIAAWVIRDPHTAGHDVSHWFNVAIDGGQNTVEAVVTFIQGIL
jgi:hypothetical protein